jgi:short-subunit dehydrogenase
MIVISIVGLLIIYAIVAYIRRKIAKPNYINKLVWVTGASSGIGEYLAYEFNRHGAHVILSARSVKELERVKASCSHPENAEVLPMDMTDYKEVRRLTQQLIERLESNGKKIDIVVENAGLSMRCKFIDYSFENHVSLFNVNVHGPFNHLQVVIPHLIKHKSGQIVGVTSLAGKLSTAYRSSYGGSKHAFIGILDSLRSELRPFGIGVCNLMPGYIKTNLAKNALAGAPGEKFGKTDLNIDGGMDPALFAKEAVGAIYNNENEVSVSDDWLPMFGVIIRNLCPDLAFKLLSRNAKTQ